MGGVAESTERKRRIHTGLLPHSNQGEKDELYDELWHACAGPLVYIPRAGERVFYFPQGHMEQVEAYTSEDGIMEMPIYNLRSKILCKVVYVQLKAEANTDEVFAQITLLPVAEQDEPSSEDENDLSLPQRTAVCSFIKTLTTSDTSTHGGFSVPKRHATEFLPPLDTTQQTPAQELVAKDLHGYEWHFRHTYRGQPKRHLLTSGWSTFVTAKKLVVGDEFIFLRGENGQLRVGVRRAAKQLNSPSVSVISGYSMQHGILAGAFHAVSTGTMFTVYYRPWTSPSEFIIPFDQYMKSAENYYSIGTRFRMRFEGEECSEKRYMGTIVGNKDIDCIRWPGSEWRCLEVKWDATPDTFLHPERVSPWNIELIESTYKRSTSIISKQNRKRPVNPSLSECSCLSRDGLVQYPAEYTCSKHLRVFQGQDKRNTGAQELDAQTPEVLPHLVAPSNPNWGHRHLGLENQLCGPMHELSQCNSNKISYLSQNIAVPCPAYQWHPIITCDNVAASRNISVSNVTSSNSGYQECRASELRDENEALLAPSTGCYRYRLFGVNLFNSYPELPSPQVATYCELSSPCSVPPKSQSSVCQTIQVSEPSKSISDVLLDKQCNNCSITNRSCTKVRKYGNALGRSVDLMRFDGYDELISELDHMFDFKGSLINGSSGWHVTFTDYEGDMMPIGDYPWQEFCLMVRKMVIYPKEEIDRQNPGSPDPTPL
ncbi:auxin response factor 9-like [Castanea sativa]|uniref:auxin response factor 9-like n=1 Tax=Castanea sativa TaxID=21020 RepID=UPI003F64C23A